MNMKKSDVLVSVVCPIRNFADHVDAFLSKLHAVLDGHYEQYEIVLVDDGSTDGTYQKMKSWLLRTSSGRAIRLSREFGLEVALTAGFDAAIGDFIVVMLPEFDPPALIPEMVECCIKNGSIIIGQRKSTTGDSLLVKASRKPFYWFCRRFLKLSIPESSTYFVALSRHAVTHINRTRDKFRFLKVITTQIGLDYELFPYDFASPGGKTKTFHSFWQSFKISVNVVTSSSLRPLRIVAFGSLLLSFFNLLYIGYVIAIYFFKSQVAEGWVTLSAQNAVSFFLVFLILAVISEYLGRTLIESMDRPLYYVADESRGTESVAHADKRNVYGASTGVREHE